MPRFAMKSFVIKSLFLLLFEVVLIFAGKDLWDQNSSDHRNQNDTGQPSKYSIGFAPPSWHDLRPYFDPIQDRWICPKPEVGHLDQSLEDQLKMKEASSRIPKSEQNSSNEFSKEQNLNSTKGNRSKFFSLEKALLLNRVVNETHFGSFFGQVTGLNVTQEDLPKTLSAQDPGTMRRPSTFRGLPPGPVTAVPALCKPELTTVKLNLTEDPDVFYYPTCTRIERCGGCCNHELLSCQPVRTEVVRMTVIRTRFDGENLQMGGQVNVPVIRHINCRCNCKIKKEDCNKNQIYLDNECRCTCKNLEEMTECNRNSHQKYWDSGSCKCKCKQVSECSTGLLFDHRTCSCSILEGDVLKPLIPYNEINNND